MIIKIDCREHELLGKIKNLILFTPEFKGLTFVTESLPIGDIIIADDKDEKLIIERKSISDLLSSIKDGRYEEQSYRLNGISHHNHNIYYLIEGDINKQCRFKNNNVDKFTIYSAMFSLNYYKGFSVFRTFNIDETAIFICNTATKLKKSSNKSPYYYCNNSLAKVVTDKIVKELDEEDQQQQEQQQQQQEEQDQQTQVSHMNIISKISSEKDYVSVVKKVKKENITQNNISEIMLCQIPGVSSVTAIAIMKEYKTISNLIKELERDNSCLNNITYSNTNGQERKITKTSITNIFSFLLEKNT